MIAQEENGNRKQEEIDIAAVSDDDGNLERGHWSGKLDFLLSCLGYAVGLGNVWRFPYLTYLHGGGAFLIPYTVMLLVIGIPCFFLEISVGQYSSLGPVTLYSNLAPLFKGLGFANFASSFLVSLYYNMIIAWTIYYTFASLTSHLPWSDCNNDFNTPFCFSISDYRNCSDRRANDSSFINAIFHNRSCIVDPKQKKEIRSDLKFYYSCRAPARKFPKDACSNEIALNEYGKEIKEDGIYINSTSCVALRELNGKDLNDVIPILFDIPIGKRASAAGEYLKLSVLNESDGIEDIGGIQWHLALCLLAAWIIIFLCLIKGIKSSGKVVYFTATFPYFVLVILFFRAVTLNGASSGIYFYLVPEWSKLATIEVWKDAAAQIFFSLSVGGGGLITLASYNEFHNNVLRDTMIVCFSNCLTSFFAGFCVFSVLGFMATEIGVEVKDVIKSQVGLAFEAYPDLVTRLPISPLWAFLFFIMLFTLGLDSQFAITETLLSGILDFQPKLRRYKTIVVGIICTVGFLLGLPLTTRGGGYVLDLLDAFAANWPYLFIGCLELIIVSYVYGIENFFEDLYHMCKFRLNVYTKSYFITIYSLIAPLLIFVILVVSMGSYKGHTRNDYIYPSEANAFGWFLALTIILSVPIVAIFQIIYYFFFVYKDKKLFERLKCTSHTLLHHTKDWRTNAMKTRAEDMKRTKSTTGIDNLGMSEDTSQL